MKTTNKTKATAKTVLQKAEDFFIENFEVTQKDVAQIFAVSQTTVCAWAKKYNWDDKRTDYHSSPVRIKQLLQKELLRIAQGEPKTLDADAISKLNVAIDRLDAKANPIVVHRILKDLDTFVSQHDPELAAKMTPFHKMFLQHRINSDL